MPRIVLGFDYGTRHMGVAIGYPHLDHATGACTVGIRDGAPDWRQIDDLIRQWAPEQLVIGMPYTKDRSKRTFCAAIRSFGKSLKQRYDLPVAYADERLSTEEARHRQAALGTSAISQKSAGKRHQIAAQIILETYFHAQCCARGCADQANSGGMSSACA